MQIWVKYLFNPTSFQIYSTTSKYLVKQYGKLLQSDW